MTYVQSQGFATSLTKIISAQIKKNTDAKIRFKELEVSLFPPGLGIHGLSLDYEGQGVALKADIGKVEIYFNWNSLDEKKFGLGEIIFKEGVLDLRMAKPKDGSRRNKVNVFQEISRVTKDIPVILEEMSVIKSIIHFNGKSLEIRNGNIVRDDERVSIKANIHNEFIATGFDEISLAADLTEKKIAINEFKVIHNLSRIDIKGELKNPITLKTLEFNGEVKGLVDLVDINPVMPQKFRFYQGFVRLDGALDISKQKGITGKFEASAEEAIADYFNIDKAQGSFSIEENILYVDKAKGWRNNGVIQISQKARLVDLKNPIIKIENLDLSLKDFAIKDIVYFLGEKFNRINGQLSGQARLSVNDKLDLVIIPRDDFELSKLGYQVSDTTKILDTQLFKTKEARLKILGGAFIVSTYLKSPSGIIRIQGKASSREILFQIKTNNVNFNEIGDIADLKLSGTLDSTINVNGPPKNILISIQGSVKNSEVLGYRLGQVNSRIDIDLYNNIINFIKLKGVKNKFSYEGDGVVGIKDGTIDMLFDIPEIDYVSLLDTVHPVRSSLDFLPKDFSSLMSGSINLYKDIGESLKLKSQIALKEVLAYEERFKKGSFDLFIDSKKVQVSRIKAFKDKGTGDGDVLYDFASEKLKFDLKFKGISGNTLNLVNMYFPGINFHLGGKVKGEFIKGDPNYKVELALNQTKLLQKSVADSSWSYTVKSDEVKSKWKVFGDWIEGGYFQNNEKAYLSSQFNIPDISLLLNTALGRSNYSKSVISEFKGSLKARSGKSWNHFKDLEFIVEKFLFSNENDYLLVRGENPKISIKDGKVISWDISESSQKTILKTHARGDFYQGGIAGTLSLSSEAEILKLISSKVLSARGKTDFLLNFMFAHNSAPTYKLTAKGQGIDLSIEKFPLTIRDLEFDAQMGPKRLLLKSFSFKGNSGYAKMRGEVAMAQPREINLQYEFDNFGFSYLTKSNFAISGQGSLLGFNSPYLLSGNFYLNRGSVLNEISELMSSDARSSSKYIPKLDERSWKDDFRLDLNLKSEVPINIINSNMDLKLVADLKFLGTISEPRAQGNASLLPEVSHIYFKNNEYDIKNAKAFFSANDPISEPEFEFASTTVINNYTVMANASGNPKNINFDLSSEPNLSKNNILSLIAFGYTEDLSSTLSADERESMTQAGVGSFIFDQFKIADVMKKQFGLQVNLGTEFVQSDRSFLEGRSQDGQGLNNSRTRTATKIELKRKISEEVNVSVSSTVGGSIGQRQSMNLNYGLDENVQLEGVYELRTNADGEEDIIDNSIGGDIKFRMSFK